MITSIAILTTALFAQDDSDKNEFGINLGWGSPFGASLQYSRAIKSDQTVGAAIGFSMSGARYGVDYKYLFNAASKFNPYIGLAGSYASGLPEVNVNVNSDTAKYEFKGGVQVNPRGGFRYQAGFANLYMNVGYGIPVVGGGVSYLSGSTKSSIKSAAEIFGMGGIEVSGSMLFRF